MAFKVQIVDINENFDNIILVSGLTIERLKIKYNWLLNASVKDCIIGEDSYGLVWYSGEWVCGEWKDGTWYSGIWHDGQWDNGKWYSYLVDKAMVISDRFVILDKSNAYSEFRSGVWKQGDFYGGVFGYDRELPKTAGYGDLTGRTFTSSYWYNGKFHDGIFRSSVWFDGIFYNGEMTGSYWTNGKFYNGTFSYHNPGGTINWYNGNWYGGNFVEGNWGNGSFDQIDANVPSRFGTSNSSTTITNWYGGTFYNGDFMSGWDKDPSGKTLPSIDCSLTQWYGGDFKGGKWWGGHFNQGNFWNGNWYGGVFGNQTGVTNASDTIWYDGNWYNGLWINGVFYDGHFYDGMWLNGQFISGYMSTNVIENPLLIQSLAVNVNLPIVTATTATSIGAYSAVANGRVLYNGGATILDRGIVYSSINQSPSIGDVGTFFVSDGGSMGNMNIQLNGLGYDTQYWYRAYARNITGGTYSNVVTFFTQLASSAVPNVQTFPSLQLFSSSFIGNGWLLSPTNPVTSYGYIWTTGATMPSTNYLVSGLTWDPNNQGQVYQDGAIVGPPCAFPVQLSISPLNPLTTYWYRAYAVNSDGIGYGAIVQAVTSANNPPTTPIVVTNSVGSIADTSAITYAQVTSNGNSALLNMGVCWSTSINPTIADSVSGTTPLNTLPYNITLTGLTSETTYHVRAFGTNAVGTDYGTDIPFTTTKLRKAPSVIIKKCVAV